MCPLCSLLRMMSNLPGVPDIPVNVDNKALANMFLSIPQHLLLKKKHLLLAYKLFFINKASNEHSMKSPTAGKT